MPKGMGYLMQGLTSGFMQSQQMKTRKEYMNAQKKIMDAKIKAIEVEDQWWAQQPEQIQKLRYAPKEMQSIGFMMAGMQGLPDMGMGAGDTGQPPSPYVGPPGNLVERPPDQLEQPPQQGQPGQLGQPQGLTDLIAQSRNNPMMRMMLEKMGIGPEPLKYIGGVDAQGKEIRQPMDPMTGKSFGEAIPQFEAPVGIDVTGATGTTRQYMRPSDLMRGSTGIQTKPPEQMTVETMDKGVTYEQEINKFTGEPIPGTKKRKKKEEKDVAAESAGKIALAQGGLNELQNVVGGFMDKDGTWNQQRLFEASMNVPFTKGRTAKQAWRRGVDGIIRAATGAAIPESEWVFYESAYLPGPMDSDQAKANKMRAFESFLNNYLDVLDPTKRMRVKFKKPKGYKKTIKPGDMGKSGKADFEYIPGQGLIPVTR